MMINNFDNNFFYIVMLKVYAFGSMTVSSLSCFELEILFTDMWFFFKLRNSYFISLIKWYFYTKIWKVKDGFKNDHLVLLTLINSISLFCISLIKLGFYSNYYYNNLSLSSFVYIYINKSKRLFRYE